MKLLHLAPLLIAVTGLSCSCDRQAQASDDAQDQAAAAAAVQRVEPDGTRQPYQAETEEELRARLTDVQFDVTQNEGTEYKGTGKYDKHYEEGIYVCLISGEALFSSKDKYDSGCGWPAFTKPIDGEEIEERTDYKIGYARTEVRAKTGDSHLGHVFEDGPADQGGLRYCINSAALRFVPKDKLVEQGYGKYASMFDNNSK